MSAGRHDGHIDSRGAEAPDQLDRGSEGAWTDFCEQNQVPSVLLFGQRPNALISRWLVGSTFGQGNLAVGQHIANPIHPVLAVDQSPVVVAAERRRDRHIASSSSGREQLLEHLGPGELVQAGRVGEHTI